METQHSEANDKDDPYRLAMQGHYGEDKTTLFEKLKLENEGDDILYYGTGFKMVKISLGGVLVECWDFGAGENLPSIGRCPSRFTYHMLFKYTDGIVYIIDSTASKKLDEALEEIESDLLRRWRSDDGDDLRKNKVLMILAIKQDAKKALSLQKIQEKAKKVVTRNSDTLDERCLFVAGCNEDQEGLEEAMTLFKDQILLRREGKMKKGFINFSTLQEKKIKKEREADSKDPSKMSFLKKIANILFH